MTIRIYRSFVRWPVSWCRLKDGWLIQFFGLTIIVGPIHAGF